jgi:hypothetical protein
MVMMSVRILTASIVVAGSAVAHAQELYDDMKLVAANGGAGDYFGSSVALSGGLAVVGAHSYYNDLGAAYLFDADADSAAFGQEIIELVPTDGNLSGHFGWSVAITDGIAAVGAYRDDEIGHFAGSVYLFDADRASPTFGQQLVKLLPAVDATGGQFGYSVAISGGIVVVGAMDDHSDLGSGSAYLFDADPASATFGQQLVRVFPAAADANDWFGATVGVSGGVAAVGAYKADDQGSNSGSGYLFDADPASPTFGQRLTKLLPLDGAAEDRFGVSIAVRDGISAVGTYWDEDHGPHSGSAYFFDSDPLSPALGQQLAKLHHPDGEAIDNFGHSISLSGGLAVVGAYLDRDQYINVGSPCVFDADPSSPRFGLPLSKLLQSDGPSSAAFGHSIAISGRVVVLGSPRDDTMSPLAGSAYLFDLNPCNPADLAFLPGQLNVDDVEAFVTGFLTADLGADCDGTGVVNVDDVDCFVTAFLTGCP